MHLTCRTYRVHPIRYTITIPHPCTSKYLTFCRLILFFQTVSFILVFLDFRFILYSVEKKEFTSLYFKQKILKLVHSLSSSQHLQYFYYEARTSNPSYYLSHVILFLEDFRLQPFHIH